MVAYVVSLYILTVPCTQQPYQLGACTSLQCLALKGHPLARVLMENLVDRKQNSKNPQATAVGPSLLVGMWLGSTPVPPMWMQTWLSFPLEAGRQWPCPPTHWTLP